MNSLDEIKIQLRSSLASQEIVAVIDILKNLLDDKREAFSTLILIEVQFRDIRQAIQRGTLDYRTESLEKNKVRNNLLGLIGDLTAEDMVSYKIKGTVKAPDYGKFTDPRDGHIYKTIELNGLVWMAENLDFDIGEGCNYYDNNPDFGARYGRMYTWEAALKACPQGWQLPTSEQWDKLGKYYGGEHDAYHALIDGGTSGFNAQLGGKTNKGGRSSRLGEYGYYWSKTPDDPNKAIEYNFRIRDQAFDSHFDHISFRFSCRCVREFNHHLP